MSTKGKKEIIPRIRSWKAACVANGLTYKEVIEAEGLKYDSVINAMGNALAGNSKAISHRRMRQLEIALLRIIESKQ